MNEDASAQRVARIIVEGKVQGVFFRDWTLRTARKLGLDGWVRNKRDGTVEMIVAGEPGRVEEMALACEEGPGSARVDNVRVEVAEEVPGEGFRVRGTD